ncbi:MAG: hypothetical protein E6R00_10145 [Gammaproteobacteria bacterium]|nr:MAG: hypothetical protein E6R00_10145 [Gammaproteobacteria bacterium]
MRDPRVWAELTAPDLIGRTRQALIAMHARNSGAMQRRKARISTFHAECLADGPAGRAAWLRAKADYENWKHGASNFGRTVSAALAEVNDIDALRAQAAGTASALKAQLTCALNAIRLHRAACDEADIAPEPHDIALWNTLESLAAGPNELAAQGSAVGD